MSDPAMKKAGDGKRRLPVLNSEEGDEQCSPAQWTAIGMVAIVLFFIPLAMLAGVITQSTMRVHLPTAGPEVVAAAYRTLAPATRLKLSLVMLLVPALALAVAALGGGAIVGRFGGGARVKEATMAGIAAGVVVVLYSFVRSGGAVVARGAHVAGVAQLFMSSLIVLLIATMMARLGGWLGVKRRPSL
jgi:hypothetical protein